MVNILKPIIESVITEAVKTARQTTVQCENGYLQIIRIDTIALRDVQLIAPSAVRLGETVLLGCKWTLEGNETLYSVKWYRGRKEFFSYLPKEYPFTRIFAQPGIDVDISRSTSQQVVLREATRALAGRYRCEVSADAPSFHTQVRSAFIHVVGKC
ncbi:unnamed protein product, partial [Brenthis ino]